jgi:ADP-ribose pyrophosphatase YjhB (NUDIX family)
MAPRDRAPTLRRAFPELCSPQIRRRMRANACYQGNCLRTWVDQFTVRSATLSNVPAHKITTHEPAGPAEASQSPSGKKTVYETSAGGVVLRHIRGTWQVAIIEPNIINADTITRRAKARPEGTVFALPKGGVDEGETPEQCANREVFEETGVRGLLLFRLTTIRYLYQRSWGGREHVSKAVSFYLFLYQSGRLGQIHQDMRDEVRKAFWFPLDKAHRKLTYRGEREVLKMAQKIVREHPERLTPPTAHVTSGPAVERPAAQQRSASQRTNLTPRPAQPHAGQPRGDQPRGGPSRSGPARRGPARGAQPPGGAPPRGPAQRASEARPGSQPGPAASRPNRRPYHKQT